VIYGTAIRQHNLTGITDKPQGTGDKMPKSDDCFIVKHGLEAFTVMPGLIWRSDILPPKKPKSFHQVKRGCRWIEFAYEKGDDCGQCSLITGFYECSQEMHYGKVPYGRATSKIPADWGWPEKAWMIDGIPYGSKQPQSPVEVPSINQMLGKTVVGPNTLVRITPKEFKHIRDKTLKVEAARRKIPLLGREPRYEQELLAIFAASYRTLGLGIDRIIDVRVAFPDVLVSIGGKEVWLELEVDSLGFWNHWKDLRKIPGDKNRRQARRKVLADNRPVAVLCWVDNDKDRQLRRSVYGLHIHELQSHFKCKFQMFPA
jgi:hypothetical protein